MKNSKITLLLLTLITLGTSSCEKNKNEQEFLGKNKIVLKANNSNVLQNNGYDKILIDVMLITAAAETIDLEFSLDQPAAPGDSSGRKDILTIENPKITLKAGEKFAQLTIKSLPEVPLTEAVDVLLQLKTNSSKIPLEGPLKLIVQPNIATVALSEEKIRLLEIYKTKGLDLYPLMGNKNLTGKINFPGGGSLISLIDKAEITLSGKTQITLSDLATAEQPVLKMVSNAMGIENYLYTLFRNLTIDDLEIWNSISKDAPPAPKKIMDLIKLSRNSAETFTVSLDAIKIDLNSKKVTFIHEYQDLRSDILIQAVPFDFHYTAWDRLQKLIEAKNPIALENTEQGGSVNPRVYLNTEGILANEYTDGINWTPSTATLTEQLLAFKFLLGHENMNDYIQVSVAYNL